MNHNLSYLAEDTQDIPKIAMDRDQNYSSKSPKTELNLKMSFRDFMDLNLK